MITGTVALLLFSVALIGFGGTLGYYYGAVTMQQQISAELVRAEQRQQQQAQQMYAQQYSGAGIPAGAPLMYLEAPARPIGFRND